MSLVVIVHTDMFLHFCLMLLSSVNNSMMEIASSQLIKRYVKSYEEYFTHIPDDRLLAMAINPILANRGCEDIKALLGDDEGQQLIDRAKDLLVRFIYKHARTTLMQDKPESAATEENESESVR